MKEDRLRNGYQYALVVINITPYIFFVLYMCRSVYQLDQLCFVLPVISFVIIALLSNFGEIINHPFQRLLLSDEGIEYAKDHLSFEAKWKDIEKIGIRWSVMGRLEGLSTPTKLINIRVGKSIELLTLFKNAFIPLSMFESNWRDSELGQQIKQYAPHLFEKEKSA